MLGFGTFFPCTDVEVDLDLTLSKPGENLLNQRAEVFLEVFGHEGVWYADDEITVIKAEADGPSQPGPVVRPVDFDLQLAQGGFPYLLC